MLFSRWLWSGLLVAGAVMMGAAAPNASGNGQPAAAATVVPHDLNLLLPPPSGVMPAVPPTSPTAAAAPIHWVYMTGSSLPASLREHAAQIDVVSPAWFHVDVNGHIYGQDSPAVTQFAKAHGIKVVPILANGEFSAGVSHMLAVDGNRQTALLNSIQTLLQTYGYDGINIDFENIGSGDRDGFSALVSNIYARLHPLGKLVTAALPAKTHDTFSGFSGSFDYAALAPNLDLALIMAYDQHYSGGAAGPIADVAWVDDVITYASSAIPARKILLGVPFYGYNWSVGGGARAMSYSDVISTVFSTGAQIHMDEASQSPTFGYGGHRVWFENSSSLKAKIDLVTNHGLAGWGGWRLGQEDPNFWTLTLAH